MLGLPDQVGVIVELVATAIPASSSIQTSMRRYHYNTTDMFLDSQQLLGDF